MSEKAIPLPKVNRQELSKHIGLSVRYVDELTKKGVLPHFKIGAAVRYDLNEVEEALRARFHIRAKATGRNSNG